MWNEVFQGEAMSILLSLCSIPNFTLGITQSSSSCTNRVGTENISSWLVPFLFPSPAITEENKFKKKKPNQQLAQWFFGMFNKRLLYKRSRLWKIIGDGRYLLPKSYGESTTWWKLRRDTDGINWSRSKLHWILRDKVHLQNFVPIAVGVFLFGFF